MPVSPKSPRPNGSVQPAGHLPRRLPEQRDGTRGPARSHEDREEEVRLARKVLKAAGVQQRGIALGMTFIDGTSIRAHPKAAGAEKRGPTARSATAVRRLAAHVAATGPRPA